MQKVAIWITDCSDVTHPRDGLFFTAAEIVAEGHLQLSKSIATSCVFEGLYQKDHLRDSVDCAQCVLGEHTELEMLVILTLGNLQDDWQRLTFLT